MTTYPIQRINFVEKKLLVLTYRTLFATLGVVVGLGILLVGVTSIRLVLLSKEIQRAQNEVFLLKSEHERFLSQMATSSTEKEQAQNMLITIFNGSPPWSVMLKEITLHIPHSLWLTEIKSIEKSDAPSHRGFTLNGESYQAEAITSFVKSLASTSAFTQVVLQSLQQKTGPHGDSYQFSIEMAIKGAAPKKI